MFKIRSMPLQGPSKIAFQQFYISWHFFSFEEMHVCQKRVKDFSASSKQIIYARLDGRLKACS